MKNLGTIILSIVFGLILVGSVYAQDIPEALNGLTLEASSQNPIPGEIVTISAVSYNFDIDSGTVIWTVNGVVKQKGIGLKKLILAAPIAGKRTTIVVTVITAAGPQFSKTITIGSGSVDMIIETDGYVPPFFKGKFPIVYQNNVKIIALPHLFNSSGKEYDPTTLTYSWKKDDGTILADQSGNGKQAIVLKGGLVPRPYNILVIASSRDGKAQGQGIISVTPESPEIVFYNDDALYGVLFNRAMGNNIYIGGQKETGAFAAMFGFNDVFSKVQTLAINWIINSTPHPELSTNKSVSLRSPDGISGISTVSLNVSGTNNILQDAKKSFNVNYNGKGNTNSSSQVTF